MNYPKRLIEVDLPIKRISAHARREKSIRRGHISTLHIWWARRPLAACRAILCAALWPDPVDPLCPKKFRDKTVDIILSFAGKAATDAELASHCSPESWKRWLTLSKPENQLDPANSNDMMVLRSALLDFIADFANWDNSSVKEYLEASRALTQAAHEALGGLPETRPLVVDPFAGGGSIPLEALRVGADAFASDLNPIPVLLNKVILEYIPKYGQRLADEIRKWGGWIKKEAEKELAEFYPKNPDGATPIAYLWARTIQCEGPGCGAEIPLIRTNILFSKGKHRLCLKPEISSKDKIIRFSIDSAAPNFNTVKSGTVTCPICGYTTTNKRVMAQVIAKQGGSDSAALLVVVSNSEKNGRIYSLANENTYPIGKVLTRLQLNFDSGAKPPTVLINPNRPSPNARGLSAVTRYGMAEFRDLYSPRQIVTLTTIRRLVIEAINQSDPDIREALGSCLALTFGRLVDRNSTLCRWIPQTGAVGYTFGRQALSMIWDYVEINPLTHSGGWSGAFEDIAATIESNDCLPSGGQAEQFSATSHGLPDDIVSALITDPPYYDAIPYADLSDFFYVWLRPLLQELHPSLAEEVTTPKEQEAIWNPGRLLLNGQPKDEAFYENQMYLALSEGRRITSSNGIGVVVFAHKSTAGWEALLNGMLQAGWVVHASWPIDTEREARTNAIGTASLASSVHLVCRPRENQDGLVQPYDIGDWRDILQELPERIHEWMPRLASEGVVGADAIFSCLGPALEIFSRYSRVEKASGEPVTLKEYLEQVWAVVAKEALGMIFSGANTTAFEEDARLTAMWLWTLSSSDGGKGDSEASEEDQTADDEEAGGVTKTSGAFSLEFDAARKIAQGLGAHLEKLRTLVEIKGDTARLLPVGERASYLFGKDAAQEPVKKKKQKVQMSLFEVLGQEEEIGKWEIKPGGKLGNTVLDRLHQSMILFAAGRAEAVKRFLVEDGVGRDVRFWQLAQAFSALYPSGSDEKRWVDGVLARKKGLGL